MVTKEQILAGRILIVDGVNTGMQAIQSALHADGYSDVTISHNAGEASKMHEKWNYDLMMLNLEVTDLDCFPVIRSLRKLENGKSLPTMVFSQNYTQRRRALDVGVRDFIQIPFVMDEVLLRVHNMIEVRLLYTQAKNDMRKLEIALREVEENRDVIQILNTALQLEAKTSDSEHEELESYSHSVSHDLRSPLRFVNKIAHMMLHNPDAPLSEQNIAQVKMIMEATDEMGQLIERLLTFSQVSREPMKIHRVHLHNLFQKIAKEQIQDNKIEIVVQDMEPCQGDKTLLMEVVANLLQNSIKFRQLNKAAKITVGCMEKDGEHVYFVKDNGVGFDMKDSDLLFIPFKSLHKREDYIGTGIGLALVKRIINRHNGRIWAEGIVNEGATFYFTLQKTPQIEKVAEKNKILLVDDDTVYLKETCAYLEGLGYEVVTAEDGRTGVKLAEEFIPNLVVLDLDFPDSINTKLRALDGLEVLQILRKMGSTLIIILSGSTMASIKVMALSFGANDYMYKPFDLKELSEHIRVLLVDKEAV